MSNRRVVITGLGVVSALGVGTGAFWDALQAGRDGIGPIEQTDVSALRIQQGAEARAFDPTAHLDGKEVQLMDRFAQFAVVAAREAVGQAGLAWTDALRARTAVVMGSCVGGQSTMDDGFVAVYREDKRRVHPLTIPRVMASAGASHISMAYGLTGPTYAVTTACSSANHAIGQAFWMVRSGQAELALAGGSEAPFSFGNLKAWEAVRVVSSTTCRPFSSDRDGMILGEGGAVLVLEPLARAQARGAEILGEVVGFGMSSDAHHLTQPSPAGAAHAMRAALADAGVPPEAVGYVNAHGTATLANDPMEAQAIHAVFGDHADRLPVGSTKSMHGHALGAAGALEGAATALALRHGLLPPTAHVTALDPACALDVVTGAARPSEAEFALSNSFAFGGLNAVLTFRRPGA